MRLGLLLVPFLLAACLHKPRPPLAATAQAATLQVADEGQPQQPSSAPPAPADNTVETSADRAAWSQAHAAWTGVWVTAAASILAAAAAYFARGAYLQAKRQADAADKAWLFFEPLQFHRKFIEYSGDGIDPITKQHTLNYNANFRITNHGKVPGQIISVGVHLFAPVDLRAELKPFDRFGNLKHWYAEATDGSIDYELSNTIIPAGGSVAAKHSSASLTIMRPLPAVPDLVTVKTIYLWLKVKFSDPGADDHEVGCLFEIPLHGRVRILFDDKKHTYRR